MPHPLSSPPVVARLAGVALLGLVTACAPTTAPSTATPPVRTDDVVASGPAAPIAREQVSSASLSGLFDTGSVTLVEGRYAGPPIVPGGAARPTAVLLAPLVALGELDDAPGADAAALVATSEGGSGERLWLAIVGVRGGRAVSIATTLVGDRTKVRALRLDGRAIVLDVVEVGPTEPACCGTQLATKTYRLTGSRLEETSSVVTGTLSLATLSGATWQAVEIDGTPLPADTRPPTLTLVVTSGRSGQSEARLTGFTGCNQYSGSIKESAPGTVAVGPAAATRRACLGDGMTIETRYLKALEKVTRYTFLAGRLHVFGQDGDASYSVTFRR